MTPDTRRIFESFLSRQRQPKDTPVKLDELCFDKQLAFIKDESLFAIAVTSRRAGKTTGCALHLLYTALEYPKTVSLYVTTARTNAKKNIWPMLSELNREMKLDGVTNESDLSIKFNNGSVLYCSGAATRSEIDRFRGLALKLVYVDEAQSFGTYLGSLIDDVLVPACFDNKGSVRLIGTPGPVPVGYFYSAFTDPKITAWSRHFWTMWDNPWIEKKRGESAQTILEVELQRRGVTESDPTIQRELFGKWVVDKRKLVIDYDPVRNHFDTLPPGKYSHIMGIDIGFKDADAIAILAHNDTSPTTYLIDEHINEKQGLTELFKQVEDLRKQYNPYKIVIDTGGLGLKIAEEMRKRWAIPVYAAEKTRKFENIELLNDALRVHRLMAQRQTRFGNDCMLIEWDTDRAKPDRKAISDRFHSDIADAVLYAFRESPAYANKSPAPPPPKWGTEAWAKEETDRMEKQAEEHFKQLENPGQEWLQ